MNIDVKLIDAWLLMTIIERDRDRLGEHHNSHDRAIHNGEYSHFLKRIIEMPEAYNVDDRMKDVLHEINELRLHDDGCPYGDGKYIYKFKQEIIDEVIDEVIEIIKKGFSL